MAIAALVGFPSLATGRLRSSEPLYTSPALLWLPILLYNCTTKKVSHWLVTRMWSLLIFFFFKKKYIYTHRDRQRATANLGDITVAREMARVVGSLDGELAHVVRALALPVCVCSASANLNKKKIATKKCPRGRGEGELGLKRFVIVFFNFLAYLEYSSPAYSYFSRFPLFPPPQKSRHTGTVIRPSPTWSMPLWRARRCDVLSRTIVSS